MQKNDAMMFLKIIVIIAIILAAISLLLPWRGYSYNYSYSGSSMSMGLDFYPWSGHFYANLPSALYGSSSSYDVWSIFYIHDVGAPEDDTSELSYSSFSELVDGAPAAAFIIGFVFCIITVIAGIFAINRKKVCLFAGILSLISIIAFVVGFESAFASSSQMSAATGVISYTWGFYIMIIAMIFFFLCFALHHFLPAIVMAGMQQQRYPGYQPPHSPGNFGYQYQSTVPKKTCPACGAVIDGKPKFCVNCGKLLN